MLLHTRPCGLSFRPTSATSRQARQVAAAAAKKQKPQRKKLRKPKQPVQQRIYMDYELDEDEEDEQGGMVQSVLLPGVAVPSAPAPASGPRERPLEPEELYAVFPKQQQPSVTALPPGKWNWGEGGNPAAAAAAAAGQAQQQDTPMWNPKTGFMKTREQMEQEAAAAAAAASSSSQPGASSQQSSSSSSSSSSRFVEDLPPAAPAWQQQRQQQQPQQQPATALQPAAAAAAPAAAAPAAADLPAVSREAVLGSCAKTSAAMLVGAAILHVFAQRYAPSLFGTDAAAVQQLLRVPAGLNSASEAGWLLGAAGAVTAARLLLLQAWGDFADATERSNKQVLSPLSWPDVLLVALLTGVSEEFLFRGGLVPLTWPDYRGVLLSGVVFGVLHVGGGRNAAFAAWATAVGWLYGGVFLASGGNVWVPAGAHALANFASAAVWMSKNGGGSSGSDAKQGTGQDTK
uniref:CAAX prenyl protease 2/Lysostaphin resistance protein A-like domain-containing protein n=1 Tax=Tetradesmus obliquus TaxID=3088 RepID=A0A383VHH7_TETOB|eukprot:jgi/Sobl393_1/10794/SZX64995.1